MVSRNARTIDALTSPEISGDTELSGNDIHADADFGYHSPSARTVFASLSGLGLEGDRPASSGLAPRIGATATA